MPPLPKRKYARARRGKRRSHMALALPALVPCPQCHSPKPAHQACRVCGTYRGREVISVKAPKAKT